jgi:hypothetical protein
LTISIITIIIIIIIICDTWSVSAECVVVEAMGSKVEYVESSHIYATNYVRNSKAIGVLWGIFTICYAIIVVVAFVTPEWIGDTLESEYPGRFGLWARCYFHSSSGGGEDCQGSLDDLSTVSSPAFRAATVFVGLSVILALLAICSMLLFFFFQSTTVFHVCGWIQVSSGRGCSPELVSHDQFLGYLTISYACYIM